MNWAFIIFDNLVSWALVLWGIVLPLYLLLRAIGLTGFREITRFEKHHTMYYRMNPVTKIVLGLVVTVVVASTIWWIGAIVSAGLLVSFLTLKAGRRKFMLGLYLTIMTVAGVTWTYAPYTPITILRSAGFTHYTVIWVWPSYFTVMGYLPELSLQAIIYGMQVSMRFTAALLAALILIMTSTPSEILKALRKVGIPEEIIFALVVAMRTVPRIFDSIDTSVKSQFMRGLGARSPDSLMPFYMVYAALASAVPVFIYMFKGARNTAIAADTRAFRANPHRTYLKPITFTKLDIYAFIFMAGMIVATALAIHFGFGRSIPYVGY